MRVEINRDIEREIANDPATRRLMYAYAKEAAAEARVIAGEAYRLGHYQRSIFAQPGTGAGAAIYGASDFKAWWVEFGSKNNKAHHPLIRAARQMRLRLDYQRGP